MGMGFMPLPGMFGSASPSATDAAALGAAVPQGGMMGTGGNNMFMNPMAAPFLYGSMFPTTPQQQGMMMLAGQAQMLGIGSGRLSGTRSGQAAVAARQRQMRGVPGIAPRPISLAVWLRSTSIGRRTGRASRKASTTGRISIIRKLGDKNNLRGFDLSERLIVPIVSPVKVDPRLPDRPLVWKRI